MASFQLPDLCLDVPGKIQTWHLVQRLTTCPHVHFTLATWTLHSDFQNEASFAWCGGKVIVVTGREKNDGFPMLYVHGFLLS